MKKTYYLTIAGLGLLLTTAIVGASSFASNSFNGETESQRNKFEHKFSAQHRQEISQAINEKNYSAWSETMKQKVQDMRGHIDKMQESINQETFDKIILARQLMTEGKTDEAKAIFQELGVNGRCAGGERALNQKNLRMNKNLKYNLNN